MGIRLGSSENLRINIAGTARRIVLPTPAYTELEYIEGTGIQYIDTGKYAPINTNIEVRFRLNNTTQAGSNNAAIFGGRNAQTSNTCTLFYIASTKPQYFRFDRASQVQVATATQISIDAESVYKFTYVKNTIAVLNERTGVTVSCTVSNPSTFTSDPITLFAVNSNGTKGTFLKGRIYEWKYWENDELLQHFIPVLDQNNIPCMYDKVSCEFFYNAGTGEFLYGRKTN